MIADLVAALWRGAGRRSCSRRSARRPRTSGSPTSPSNEVFLIRVGSLIQSSRSRHARAQNPSGSLTERSYIAWYLALSQWLLLGPLRIHADTRPTSSPLRRFALARMPLRLACEAYSHAAQPLQRCGPLPQCATPEHLAMSSAVIHSLPTGRFSRFCQQFVGKSREAAAADACCTSCRQAFGISWRPVDPTNEHRLVTFCHACRTHDLGVIRSTMTSHRAFGWMPSGCIRPFWKHHAVQEERVERDVVRARQIGIDLA